MAAFASDRRSGWVRVLVLILCALFIFATIATPPAYAAGETVALFGLAAVLSAATAALGFKLANNAEGQATLQKMVQDFAGASIAAGLVLTGSKLNGLVNGMQYIKMAVHNGKTYLDERIFAWCQKWLAQNGVYDTGGLTNPDYVVGSSPSASQSFNDALSVFSASVPSGFSYDSSYFNQLVEHYSIDWRDSYVYQFGFEYSPSQVIYNIYDSGYKISGLKYGVLDGKSVLVGPSGSYIRYDAVYQLNISSSGIHFIIGGGSSPFYAKPYSDLSSTPGNLTVKYSNGGSVSVSSSNTTGLSGTDTLGKDVIDLTLDQILEKLKEWAQDWYDAGADSVTNAATGAKDLPLSVATGAATANPALNPDDVYNPPFALPLPGLRSGETDTNTVEQGKENASAAETATTDVAENQTVIDSLVNWALGYISPDTGLFSKFPLCVPYDAYLLACASLGVDFVESDSIFSASPDDLSSIVQTGTDEQSEGFTPVLTISNDLTLDGYTYPLNLTIDLTEWTPLIKFVRLAISITVIAELIGAEYKRIKGK